jgi:autophagy-related protein 101
LGTFQPFLLLPLASQNLSYQKNESNCYAQRVLPAAMEPLRAPEYTLQVFADPTYVEDIVKAILSHIFFHRYFTPIAPQDRDILDETLTTVEDGELEAMMEQRVSSLVRGMQMSSRTPSSGTSPLNATAAAHARVIEGRPEGRGQIAMSFFERKRRKTYFFGKADEDVCWETWILDVTCATPRTDAGVF